MQIDTQTIRRLRDLLLERAGIGLSEAQRRPLDESSLEMLALVARVAPMGEALYLMMMADGESKPFEIASLRGAIETLTASTLSASTLDGMLETYASNTRREGTEARLMRVGAELCADPEDAEMTLALAAAVALADGAVAIDETTMLDALSEWLGISPSRAQRVLGR